MYRRKFPNIILFVCICMMWVLLSPSISAQDTISDRTASKAAGAPGQQRQRLKTVVISKGKKPSATLSQAPVQVFDVEKIEQTGALLLSDAIKQMAGVTVRDYGGVGGMKTVSARGLGSQFSTLTIDGVAVNDCQNGQVDLSRYMLGNSAYVSLSNGQPEDVLLTARAAAAGSVVNMESQQPTFMPGERWHARVGMEAGSFGLLSPTLALDRRLGKRTTLSLWGNYLRSKGDYPYTLYYTPSHNDSSSVERREHSAMWLVTGDGSLFFNISPSQQLTAKMHYVQGYHELPGPVVYYAKKGSEDTKEKLFFTQVRYLDNREKFQYQIIGKYQYTNDFYEDFRAATASRYLSNEYSQQEGYLSASAAWKPTKGLSIGAATDEALTALHSSLSNNSNVNRITSLNTLTLQYDHRRFTARGNLLATLVSEDACDNPGKVNYRKVSPYIGISVKPLAQSNIRVRYFFKETYRVPNFNEMYYFTMPLDTLRPECATQHNVGITLPMTTRISRDSMSQRFYSLTIDGYINKVKDKIIAVPRQNMFIWSTMNLGLVDITGLDVRGIMNWEWQRKRKTGNGGRETGNALEITVTYSYQHAVDHTDPDNPKTYDNQIPYTPRHSGGVTLYFKNPWVNVGYNCMIVGERYYQAQNTDESRMPAYADQGITLDRNFELPIGDLRLQFQVLNIFDEQYEVVRSYPMMGRNFRIKATYSF